MSQLRALARKRPTWPVVALDSEEFIDNLLLEKHIFIAPGTIFGSNGKGYVRFSLCADENAINEAIIRTK